MTLFNPQFQILSDIHLETPTLHPSYTFFSRSPTRFPLLASNLLLLGDIGLVQHHALFSFLRYLLERTPNLRIFYVPGNHEAYGMPMDAALSAMRTFEEHVRAEFGERFWFMDRQRVDVSPTLTILGCALWSRIDERQSEACASALTDFHETNGIRDRTVQQHNADHARDLEWLNEQVGAISASEGYRKIIVLTHHSPTADPRANDPVHADSNVNSGFRTDLSKEACWTSLNVKLWAFGHTHFSCQYVDEEDGRKKLVVSNQKGYAYPEGQGNWEVKPMVVEAGEGEEAWKIVVGKDEEGKSEEARRAGSEKTKINVRGGSGARQAQEEQREKESGLKKVGSNIKKKLGLGKK